MFSPDGFLKNRHIPSASSNGGRARASNALLSDWPARSRAAPESVGDEPPGFWRRAKERLFARGPRKETERQAPAEAPPPAAPMRAGARVAVPPGGPVWQPLIDPMAILSGILRAKRLIVLTTVAGAILGVLVALATPKQYYAATDLLFDPRDLQLIERDLTRGTLPSDATLALIENQVAIIRSRNVLDKVVERLNLTEDPEFNGEGGTLLGTLTNWRALLPFGGGEEGPASRQALTVQNLAESLHVERLSRTFVISIGITTQDPGKSARIANTTAQVFLDTTAAMAAGRAGKANSEITAQLDTLRAEVERAEQAVADFKARNDIIDAQGRLISEDEIVRLNDQLSTARARTAELSARVASARALDVNRVLGGALPEQVDSPVMTELLAQYARLKQQADRAAAQLGPRHPDNQAVQAELAGLRAAIGEELRRVVASLQVELERAVELEQDLAGRLARLKVQKGELENERVRLRELQREAEAHRAVYEAFLLRARETGEQRDLNSTNISIISTAYPPLQPTGLSRAAIAIAGTLLGFLAGVFLGGGTAALGSLRENLADRREAAQGRAAPVDENGPQPPDSPSTGMAAPAAPAEAVVLHGARVSPPPADRWQSREEAIEQIRHRLRIVREEVDMLTRERARRAG